MKEAIDELAAKRRRWVDANRENGFEAGLKRLLTDLYPDSAHFIYELLQNAEDAYAQEVRFILHEDRIEFEHDGDRLFTIQDVDAITSIGFSTKRDDTTSIGKFGVGFKAVFAYTNLPEIQSGEYRFFIQDMVIPDPKMILTNNFKLTRFILPFNSSRKPKEKARNEIEALLTSLDATALLFLRHIHTIEYLLPDTSLGYIKRIELGDNRFEILVQLPNETEPSPTWFLKFDKEVQVDDEEVESEHQKAKSCHIALAFGLTPIDAKASVKEKKGGGAETTSEWELAPIQPGRVCIYFPADKETSNLRFHLHAPFASTVARDSVRDCTGNYALRDHLSDLLAESMSAIRNQGFLNVRALALLPNDKDNLPEFYQPLMKRLIEEFQEKDLVPMKRGGHAAAKSIFRGSKALSDLVDDDDLVTLLGDDYITPIWVSNPPQRNQPEDNFLSMLFIQQWDVAELVKALGSMDEGVLARWMGSKDDKWHQTLYELLIDFINAASKAVCPAAASRKETIKNISLVRCSDDIYRKGNQCFFPAEGVDRDGNLPRAVKDTYFAGKEENKKAREFLEAVGVREVDEKVEIECLLKTRYSEKAVANEAFPPDIKHILKFVALAEKYPESTELFRDYYIFKLNSGKWGKPSMAYLDSPFLETELNICSQILGKDFAHKALSDEYATVKIKPEIIGAFAKRVGALTELSINIDRGDYSIDSSIAHLDKILESEKISTSRLVWRTLISCEKNGVHPINKVFHKWERLDRRCNFSDAGDSFITELLKEKTWIPQKMGEAIKYVQPRDAVAEKLPEGFEYQTGWQWIKYLDFGQNVEERREAQDLDNERQTKDRKFKEDFVRHMGFESLEEAEEIARLTKENPEEYTKFKEAVSIRKARPTFPNRPVPNPERRQEHLEVQLSDAPVKEYEKRERRVRTTNGAIDPKTWLRNQYTNDADQMICQICKEEMPFRKRDGAHYFEKKELFSSKYLTKEHEAQYLALCPLCAAKYDEFVKNDDEVMAKLWEEIISTKDCEIPILLGHEKTSIRFVETHYHDLKTIIESVG